MVTENMNNTNEINILTNQAQSTYPGTQALGDRRNLEFKATRNSVSKRKGRERRGGEGWRGEDPTLRVTSITNSMKVYDSLGIKHEGTYQITSKVT